MWVAVVVLWITVGNPRIDRPGLWTTCGAAISTERGGSVQSRSMPYPKKLLNSYETLSLDLHPHWWYFAETVAALIGSIALGVVSLVVFDEGSNGRKLLGWVSLGLIVVCALWLIARYLKWLTTNFVITSDRLIFRQGVLAKSGIEIPLERVNNVNFKQSVFERVIGAGDLLIESGGEDGQQRFTDIRHPEKIQNLIHEQMEYNEQRKFGQGGGGMVNPADVATQLEKLEGLLQRGSLTPEEFEAQKRKLLG